MYDPIDSTLKGVSARWVVELAPSELVLLSGMELAPSRSISRFVEGAVEIPYARVRVSAFRLGEAILVAALSANAEARAIRLEARPRKGLLNLRSSNSLFVEPSEGLTIWPAESLEAKVRTVAEELRSRGRNHIANVVYHIVAGNYLEPWQQIARRVEKGLEARGLLQRASTSEVDHRDFEPSIISTARRQAMNLRALLLEHERDDPETWRLLIAGVKNGMALARPRFV